MVLSTFGLGLPHHKPIWARSEKAQTTKYTARRRSGARRRAALCCTSDGAASTPGELFLPVATPPARLRNSNCPQPSRFSRLQDNMKFLDWYVKIGLVSAMIGASMELFMIKTGFYDKVTVLESEKRAWESSPEALAVKEALNPWRQKDSNVKENV